MNHLMQLIQIIEELEMNSILFSLIPHWIPLLFATIQPKW